VLFAVAAWWTWTSGEEFPFARQIAGMNVALGVALGVYTGILLGALSARPLWNSPVLGPLFLASGLSGAAALLYAMERDSEARHKLARWDERLLAAEGVLLALFLLGLATGGEAQRSAFQLLSGGAFTAVFWVAVVFAGMAIPVLMERLERAGRLQPSLAAPLLVLIGGFSLRAILLWAGQASGWEVI
jgi:formate-dependent nitrite reductase membrane component NrfD